MVFVEQCRASSTAPAGCGGRSTPHAMTLFLLACLVLPAGCGERVAPPDEPALPVGTGVGEIAPALTGTAADGRRFDLQPDGRTATVLVFYRGYHCGLCRERLRELQRHLPQYRSEGANVVALSADSVANVRLAVEELGLTFPVVAVDSAALSEWEVFSGGDLPLPASYLLDSRGTVAFRHVGRNAADRTNDLELLAALQDERRRGR
jgi:peroxiredoxin